MFFKLNSNYYLGILYKNNIKFSSKSKTINKFIANL